MCLAIPGKVIEVFQDRGLRMARVDFGEFGRFALEGAPRMIGSDAPSGRKTANRMGASKSASPCS